jgi:hypothetical protein
MAMLHRRLLQAALCKKNHSILVDQVLSELLPGALKCRPEEYEGICMGTATARR